MIIDEVSESGGTLNSFQSLRTMTQYWNNYGFRAPHSSEIHVWLDYYGIGDDFSDIGNYYTAVSLTPHVVLGEFCMR